MVPVLSFIGGAPGGGEILVIFIAVLVLFGSKNLPKMARSLGKAFEEFQKAARQVKDEVMRADMEPPPAPRPPQSLPPVQEVAKPKDPDDHATPAG